jgi:acyl-CoA hydrolase
MENFRLVLPEHLNHFGYLFGGQLLRWIDEVTWIAASLEFPGCNFVTIGMDRVEFRKPVRGGAILRFAIQRSHQGATSVQYSANVFADDIESGREDIVFSTHITFVCLDESGNKAPLLRREGPARGTTGAL